MHEPTRGAPELVQNPTRGWLSPLALRIRVWDLRCGPSRGVAKCEWQHLLLLRHVGEECDLGKLDLHSQADRLAEVPLAHALPQSRRYVGRLRRLPLGNARHDASGEMLLLAMWISANVEASGGRSWC
jgi:hypothetical protein